MKEKEFRGNIARIQWNNHLASNLLFLWSFLAIVVFCFLLVAPVFAVASLIEPQNFSDLLQSSSTQRRLLIIIGKVILFTSLSIYYFIHRDFENTGASFHAQELNLDPKHSFYKKLEELCISRGLSMPKLYLFSGNYMQSRITAAVLQGTGKRAKVILTDADLQLPANQAEALIAQIVQRIHTKDALFLTALCFIGYFPYHMMQGVGVIRRFILKPSLTITDKLMAPLRNLILELRLSKLDVGSLELTKAKAPSQELLSRLERIDNLKEFFHDPYLPLFIGQTDTDYRSKNLARA